MSTAYAKFSGLVSGGSGGSGTVTSVALADGSTTPIFTISGSPVTTSGTLTETLKTQTANKIFAGPTSGGAAQPTFRSLVSADLPAISGPASLIRVTTPNGHGSSGTTVRTWSVVQSTVGTDVSYTSDAVNGDFFTINVTGNYSITVTDCNTGAAVQAAITLNCTGGDLSTAASSLAVGKRLVLSSSITQFITAIPGLMSLTYHFTAGDVVRFQDDSPALNSTTDTSGLTICRVS